jgi:outer membrane protein assembly factor BamB
MGLALGFALFALSERAHAVIMRLTPLSELLAGTRWIFVAKIEKIYPDKPALVLSVDQPLKGKPPYGRFPINLAGDSAARKAGHTEKLRRRLAPGLPVVVFANPRDRQHTLFAFTNGTWFQVVGRKAAGSDKVYWSFTHCEPYLRRTFAGTTADLRRVIRDGLSGKKKPPGPEPKEKPGLGPELKKSVRSGLPLAVIPTIGIGGPLAVLALLFPGLFGGALLVFRNWLALLTVAGVNSTLLVVHLWFGRALEATWLATPLGLWFLMLLVTLAGVFWSWRRQLRAVQAGADAAGRPSRSERIILVVASIILSGAFLWCWSGTPRADDPSWKLLLVFTVGSGTGMVYVLYRAFVAVRRAHPSIGLPSEGVILGAMAVASVGLAAAWPGQAASTAGTGEIGQAAPGNGQRAVTLHEAWTFAPTGKSGLIVSSCRVDGDRVYVAAALRLGAENYGTLYCLSRKTGREIWHFDNGGDMKQVFSTPCLADGRVFVGEGFHTDPDCRLFCLDAKTGKKRWDFATTSHTESSPCVAGGRVYFGAGEDGVYCLDAKTGKKRWQYPGKDGDATAGGSGKSRRLRLHVDSDPAVAGNLLYAGSGIDRDGEDAADPGVFCLDARTGKKIWLVPLPRSLPAWGSPVADGGEVFFGLGNGDVFDDAKDQAPGGALLCIEAATGRQRWRYDVPNGVLKRPAVDAHHVYFGARDGTCYCLDRTTGQPRWKCWLGSPVVSSPALARCSCCGGTAAVYVLASAGRVCCFEPDKGRLLGAYQLGRQAHLSASPFVEVLPTPKGDRRRVYFGTGLEGLTLPVVYCLEE